MGGVRLFRAHHRVEVIAARLHGKRARRPVHFVCLTTTASTKVGKRRLQVLYVQFDVPHNLPQKARPDYFTTMDGNSGDSAVGMT